MDVRNRDLFGCDIASDERGGCQLQIASSAGARCKCQSGRGYEWPSPIFHMLKLPLFGRIVMLPRSAQVDPCFGNLDRGNAVARALVEIMVVAAASPDEELARARLPDNRPTAIVGEGGVVRHRIAFQSFARPRSLIDEDRRHEIDELEVRNPEDVGKLFVEGEDDGIAGRDNQRSGKQHEVADEPYERQPAQHRPDTPDQEVIQRCANRDDQHHLHEEACKCARRQQARNYYYDAPHGGRRYTARQR